MVVGGLQEMKEHSNLFSSWEDTFSIIFITNASKYALPQICLTQHGCIETNQNFRGTRQSWEVWHHSCPPGRETCLLACKEKTQKWRTANCVFWIPGKRLQIRACLGKHRHIYTHFPLDETIFCDEWGETWIKGGEKGKSHISPDWEILDSLIL